MNLNGLRREFITTMTPLYDADEAMAMFNFLLRERFDWQPHQLRTMAEKSISQQEEEALRRDMIRLSSGEPLQYVLGYAWFNGLKIGVNPHVLIPRPETEEMTILASRQLNRLDPVILDACTGSGCIALDMSRRFPASRVFASDFSMNALEVAVKNAESLNLKVEFYHQDVLDPDSFPPAIAGQLDLLISNPPYVMANEAATLHPNVIDFEPRMALFVPDEDPVLYYRALAEKGWSLIKPGGAIWFETGVSLTASVAALLQQNGYDDVQILEDTSGNPRFVKGNKSGL